MALSLDGLLCNGGNTTNSTLLTIGQAVLGTGCCIALNGLFGVALCGNLVAHIGVATIAGVGCVTLSHAGRSSNSLLVRVAGGIDRLRCDSSHTTSFTLLTSSPAGHLAVRSHSRNCFQSSVGILVDCDLGLSLDNLITIGTLLALGQAGSSTGCSVAGQGLGVLVSTAVLTDGALAINPSVSCFFHSHSAAAVPGLAVLVSSLVPLFGTGVVGHILLQGDFLGFGEVLLVQSYLCGVHGLAGSHTGSLGGFGGNSYFHRLYITAIAGNGSRSFVSLVPGEDGLTVGMTVCVQGFGLAIGVVLVTELNSCGVGLQTLTLTGGSIGDLIGDLCSHSLLIAASAIEGSSCCSVASPIPGGLTVGVAQSINIGVGQHLGASFITEVETTNVAVPVFSHTVFGTGCRCAGIVGSIRMTDSCQFAGVLHTINSDGCTVSHLHRCTYCRNGGGSNRRAGFIVGVDIFQNNGAIRYE